MERFCCDLHYQPSTQGNRSPNLRTLASACKCRVCCLDHMCTWQRDKPWRETSINLAGAVFCFRCGMPYETVTSPLQRRVLLQACLFQQLTNYMPDAHLMPRTCFIRLIPPSFWITPAAPEMFNSRHSGNSAARVGVCVEPSPIFGRPDHDFNLG